MNATLTALWLAMLLSVTALAVEPDKPLPAGTEDANRRTWLVADYTGKKLVIYREGQGIVWTHNTSSVYDCCARPDGHVLWAGGGGVHEMIPDLAQGQGGRLLWRYKPGSAEPAFKGEAEVHSCEVQCDGTVITAEAGSQRLVTLDPAGKVVSTATLTSATPKTHLQFRLVRRSPAGTQWVALLSEGLAREVAADGTVRRTVDVLSEFGGNRLYTALPLANGNLLLSTAGVGAVFEIGPDDRVVWQFTREDAKAAGFQTRWLAGVCRLPNGNTVVCDWQGHSHTE